MLISASDVLVKNAKKIKFYIEIHIIHTFKNKLHKFQCLFTILSCLTSASGALVSIFLFIISTN
jgi:hypothetical protein